MFENLLKSKYLEVLSFIYQNHWIQECHGDIQNQFNKLLNNNPFVKAYINEKADDQALEKNIQEPIEKIQENQDPKQKAQKDVNKH